MSEYGNPPQDPNTPQNPYGQPNPYGQANPYGQPNPYGQSQAPYGQPAGYGYPLDYANWFKRVGAYLVDQIAMGIAGLPLWIGYGMVAASARTTTNADGTVTTTMDDPSGTALLLMVLGALTTLAFFIWNSCIRQGRTGYSLGKSALGIKLIGEQTGQPIGAGMSFLRQILHIVDSICYLGYLWPLWDRKRQTFADKILKTVVLNQPQG
jgi:uncharacterized RDD family membrane protein YckC